MDFLPVRQGSPGIRSDASIASFLTGGYSNDNFHGRPPPDTAQSAILPCCSGRVLRVSHSGKLDKIEVVATGLMFPTAMTFGPDGNLYVSTFGYGFPPGSGQIVKVTVP